MLITRFVLFAGWIALISSLFWDTLTPELTKADAFFSPFRAKTPGVYIQGNVLLPNEAYSLVPRIFWAMLVPLLPLFFMVFGHEAWRRICPLSFASQIPRLLGINRIKTVVQRRTGTLEKKIFLIDRNSWLFKYKNYFQFGLLVLGLASRLLYANSSRLGLALLLTGIISAAILVGYLWEGKTWCNYFCPVNIVQKIYTEPRGLLESRPHFARIPISQSMCRTTTPKGEKSACVGCTQNCGDIDLEKSYWESIKDPTLRHAYYMFFGVILGFYGYFYLYAGTWEYYFTGIWTHENNLTGKLLDPGFYIFDTLIPVPKIIAAPLTLVAASAIALFVGKFLEKKYSEFRKARSPITDVEIIHHCLSFSAYISINTFYFFAGRPNLLLAPVAVVRIIDLVIVAMSTLWFWQALQRTPTKYRRESLASSLIQQLKKLKVDVSKYLEGRQLEELKPDEVYILTKVLPAFSHEQKLQAYRNILDDAVNEGNTSSPVTLELLGEIRTQMDVSEDEHLTIIDLLGRTYTAAKVPAQERMLSIKKYEEITGTALLSQIEAGKTLSEAISDGAVDSMLQTLRASFQITDAEHAVAVEKLMLPGGAFFERFKAGMETLLSHAAFRKYAGQFGISEGFEKAIFQLLDELIKKRLNTLLYQMFSILRSMGSTPEAIALAAGIRTIAPGPAERLLSAVADESQTFTWEESLAAPVVAALLRSDAVPLLSPWPSEVEKYSQQDVLRFDADPRANMVHLLSRTDDIFQALVIYSMGYVSHEMGVALASRIPQSSIKENGLLSEVIEDLISTHLSKGTPARTGPVFKAVVSLPDQTSRQLSLEKFYITVGSDAANDICLPDALVSPRHFAVRREMNDVQLLDLSSATVFLDGKRLCEANTPLRSPTAIHFSEPAENGPCLTLEWTPFDVESGLFVYDRIARLVWLARHPALKRLNTAKLMQMATAAEVEVAVKGARIRRKDSHDEQVFIVQQGTVRVRRAGDSEETSEVLSEGRVFSICNSNALQHEDDIIFTVESDVATFVSVVDPAHIELLQSLVTKERNPQ